FSSRRRHTRFSRDWSSDVCSSDLINEALTQASNNKVSSLKDFLAAAEVKNDKGEVLQHGINSIEMLFPEAAHATNGNEPLIYKEIGRASCRERGKGDEAAEHRKRE